MAAIVEGEDEGNGVEKVVVLDTIAVVMDSFPSPTICRIYNRKVINKQVCLYICMYKCRYVCLYICIQVCNI